MSLNVGQHYALSQCLLLGLLLNGVRKVGGVQDHVCTKTSPSRGISGLIKKYGTQASLYEFASSNYRGKLTTEYLFSLNPRNTNKEILLWTDKGVITYTGDIEELVNADPEDEKVVTLLENDIYAKALLSVEDEPTAEQWKSIARALIAD